MTSALPVAAKPRDLAADAMWVPRPPRDVDVHAAFAGTFTLATQADVEVGVQASNEFRVWVDGRVVVEGLCRFAARAPEYQRLTFRLGAGRHTVAVHAHHDGVASRIGAVLPAFCWCVLRRPASDAAPADAAGAWVAIPVGWRCRVLDEYTATGLRISPLLGHVEWADRPVDAGWHAGELAASSPAWVAPVGVPALAGLLGPATASPVALPTRPDAPQQLAVTGRFRETCTGAGAYRFDDPAMQHVLTDLDPPPGSDVDGRWYRYDLGRLRLGWCGLDVDMPAAGEATLAYCERLGPTGRPVPVVPLSLGPTRMIQHFALASGHNRVEPLQSLGARYLEVRIRGPEPRSVRARFRERDPLGAPVGSFDCGDELLRRIWQTGLDTVRACTEDAVVDSCRERGEWVGDVVTVASELLAVGWGELSPIRRALAHAAATARADGLVAGCGPVDPAYLGTYAAQWVPACLRYAELSGDRSLLTELAEPAAANMTAIAAAVHADGTTALPWPFVDWGRRVVAGRADAAVLAHVQAAATAWLRWRAYLRGRGGPVPGGDDARWQRFGDRIAGLVARGLAGPEQGNGYHGLALAAHAGLRDPRDVAEALLTTLRRGFPFDPAGVRPRDPETFADGIVTPYFTHYSVAVLLSAGRVDEVLDLWRRGWGWLLDAGATTWWEVFDDRWSHCHAWSGAPTWQMSRFLLGLGHPAPAVRPGPDGRVRLRLAVTPGHLRRATGRVPLAGTGAPAVVADVQWERRGDGLVWTVDTPVELALLGDRSVRRVPAGRTSLRLTATTPRPSPASATFSC